MPEIRSYTDEELVRFFRRSHRYARMRGSLEGSAQDFSSWAILQVLEGRPPKLQWLYADYHRELMGRTGSVDNAIRQEIYSPSAALNSPISANNDRILEEVLPRPEPEPEDLELEDLSYVGLPRDVQEIIDHIHMGRSYTEIARIYGKSECWVSWKLSRWRLAVARIAVERLKQTAPLEAELDLALEVQWLELP